MALQPLFGRYAAQIEPQRTATALPTATLEDYGAGVGDALLGAGNVAGEIAKRAVRLEAEREYDRQLSERQLAWAKLQADYGVAQNEDRQNGENPGAQGHTAAMTQWIDKAGEEFLGGIQHPGLRQKFAARFEEWKTGRVVEADAFERTSGARLIVQQRVAAREIVANRARFMNEVELQETLEEIATSEKLYGITADQDLALRRDDAKAVVASYLEGQPPAVRLAALDSGIFDAVLAPEEKDQIRKGGKIELRAEEMAQEEAAKDARVAAREQLAAIEARQARGDVVSAKEAQAAIAAAQAAGVPGSELIRFQTDFEDNATLDGAYSEREDPTGERSARRAAEIAAKPEAERSPWERRNHSKLVQRADARAVDQGAVLKEVYNSGPAGQLQAAGQIRSLPTRERQYAVAEKISEGFGDVVMLPTAQLRAAAIEGAAILKDRPDLVSKDDAEREYAKAVGGLSQRLGTQYGGKLEVAKGLYAGWAARTGAKRFDRAAFGKYVNVAFGATMRGDGTLQGGLGDVNGYRVLLPDEYNAAELGRAIARTDWSQARGRGAAVPKSFIINHMYPVLVDETADRMIYHMRDEHDNELKGPDGRSAMELRVDRRKPR